MLERRKLLMRQTPGGAVASPPPTASTTTTPTANAPSSPLPSTTPFSFDTNALVQQYEALFNWTVKSIDTFRAQLLPVCFVAFQQTFLALQGKNSASAAEFYSLHYAPHQAQHAHQLQQLLAGKPLLQQTPIKLDCEVKQILLQFLSNNRPELLGVINEFCSFGEAASAVAVSRSPSPQPQSKVRLGVPKRIRTYALAEDTVEQMPDLQSSYWRNLDKILPQAVASPTPTQSEPGTAKPFPSIAMMQFAHSEGMISFSSSDLGRTFAAGFEDGSVGVWFGSSQQQKLVAHSAPVYDLSLFGANKLLTCSGDGTVRYWQSSGNAFRNVLQFSCVNAWCVSFAPCGYYFIVGSRDGTCRLFSLENNSAPLRVFANHNGDVDCVCWHPNLHYVFTGSADGFVRMFDVVNSSSTACRTFSCGGREIDKLVCDPSGRFVSCSTAGGEVFVFDISTERALKQCKVVDGEEVHSMSWSPDGAFLALAVGQNQVAVFDVCDDSLFSVQQQQTIVPRMFATNSTLSLHVNFIKPNIILAAGLVARSF